MFEEKYTVLDIECWHTNNKVEIESAELRYVGFLSRDGNRAIFHSSEVEKIQKAIDYFPYIVTHNGKEYDVPILEKFGFKFYGKVVVDTLTISINRLKTMLYLDLNQGDKSLRKLCERFDLRHKKGEFDYALLQKEKLEGEELKLLEDYLYGDLESCNDLYRYYYEMFYGFKEYMNEENQRRMCWLVNPPGSTAYKCICSEAGLPEDYNEELESTEELYAGGYVSEPYCDFIEG